MSKEEPVEVSKTVAATAIDWDADVVADPEESYQSLVRSLQRTAGFSLFFVRCVPGDQADLVQRLQADLPTLLMQRLELKEELVDGNLYQRVATLPNLQQINVLFISGLEKSLDPYVKSGYGGQGDYYKLDTVPRVLGHLNLQRERFRDDFPFCFVFFLNAFGIKYIARRAPDFFDWRSGIFEFIPDSKTVGKLTQELQGDYQEYLTWSHTQRLDRIRDIQAILEEDQQTPNQQASLWVEKGNILFADRNYETAIASYDKALEFKPDYHLAWYNRGNTLLALGRNEEAITSCDQAIEFKPDYHEAWSSRGACLNNLQRFTEAIDAAEEALRLKPTNHHPWYVKSYAQNNLGLYEEALINGDRSIQLDPDYDFAWLNQGVVLSKLGRYEEAIASYDRAIAIKPNQDWAWNNRGNALSDLGRKEEAITSYDHALEIKPDKHEAWNSRGNALFNLGRYEEAIASYEQAATIKPDYHEAWNNRGNALSDLGRKEEAITNYDKAIEFKPDYHEAWFTRGNALSNLGRKEEAITSYDKALEIKPDKHKAWNNRSDALFALGRYKGAIASRMKAAQILQELDAPLADMPYPTWIKSALRFAQRGKLETTLLVAVVIVLAPFYLVWLLLFIPWQLLRNQVRRSKDRLRF